MRGDEKQERNDEKNEKIEKRIRGTKENRKERQN